MTNTKEQREPWRSTDKHKISIERQRNTKKSKETQRHTKKHKETHINTEIYRETTE